MKRFLLTAVAFIALSALVNAQSTADSIAAKYRMLPMPEPLTMEKKFPALGSYQLTDNSGTTAGTVTITLDTVNKGTIWVEGLPEGRFKAYLRKSPATYRILAQKTGAGKQIQEGTLLFDGATNQLFVAFGAPYVEKDPELVFAALRQATPGEVEMKVKTNNSKTKSKVKYYTATKVQPEISEPPATDQQQQQQQQER